MKKLKDKNSSTGQGCALLLLYLFIGAMSGICILKSSNAAEPYTNVFVYYWFMLILFLASLLYVHIIIHELGHMLFGIMTGYKFLSYRFYSFMWIKKDGKLCFRRMSLGGTGGQCLMLPPEMVDGKIPYFWYNAGGCIVNIAVSAIALCLYFIISVELPYLRGVMFVLALAGIVTALINGIPLKNSTLANDGSNIARIKESDEAMYSFWVQLSVNAELAKEKRLKDMPDEWFYIPSNESMKNRIVSSMAFMYSNRLLDEHRIEDAKSFIDKLRSANAAFNSIEDWGLTCDRMYCEIVGDCDESVIRDLQTPQFMAFMKQMKKHISALRTEYAYALIVEKDELKAAKLKLAFDKASARYPNEGEVTLERELINIADARHYNMKNAQNEVKQ